MTELSTYIPSPEGPLRVLFVDDDPDILRGIERSLFACDGDEWEFEFADGGEQAIQLFDADPFDVIVSDMRMPKIDGAELLSRVSDSHPGALRIILSGHTEIEAAMRAMPVAHQFLSKPTQADELLDTIKRGFELRRCISNPKVREAAGEVKFLPPRPTVYAKIIRLLGEEDTSLAAIGDVVAQDIGISSKLLHIANNAFFNRGNKVTSIHEAVTRVGPRVVKDIALSTEAFGSFKLIKVAELDALTRESLIVATIARELAEGKEEKELAFSAGLLHDVGRLVILWKHRRGCAEVDRLVAAGGHTCSQAEREVLGVTHAELGAYLLGLWGLPYPVIESVLCHHDLDKVKSKLLSHIYIAEAAFAATHDGYAEDPADEALIEEMGLLEVYAQALTIAQSDDIRGVNDG